MRLPMIAALLLLSAFGCGPSDPPDLAAYVAEVRERGMAEPTQQLLERVAGIATGAIPVRMAYQGGVWQTQQGNPPLAPDGRDAEEDRRRQAVQDAIADVVRALEPMADADRSGFVSSAEAKALYNLVMTGLGLAHLQAEADLDYAAQAKAMHVSRADLQRMVRDFNAIVDALPPTAHGPLTRIRASDP